MLTRWGICKRFFGQLSKFKKEHSIGSSGHYVNRVEGLKDELSITTGLGKNEIRELARRIDEDKKFAINPPSVGRILYNLSKIGYQNVEIEKCILNQIDQWKNKFSMRLAFGFYYGALKMSLDRNLVYFARNEYEKFFTEEYLNSEIENVYFGNLTLSINNI